MIFSYLSEAENMVESIEIANSTVIFTFFREKLYFYGL